MKERVFSFTLTSDLRAAPAVVWAQATDPAAINRELWPLARMTFPRGADTLRAADLPLGQCLGRSWLLLFGLLPVDYDDLTLLRLRPGVEFLEVSPMLSQREWQHHRLLEPIAGGTRLTDAVRFIPRVAPLGPVYRAVFRRAFALRHRHLRRRFGVCAITPAAPRPAHP
jgi:hypothetical protein